jgi:hypothetical protein
MAGAMAGMMIGGPFVATALGLSGGLLGAVFGDVLMSRALETDKEEIDRKKTKLASLALDIETMQKAGVNTQGKERQYKNLSEEISVLETAGPLDDNANVLIINQVDQSSSSVNATSSGVSVIIDDSSGGGYYGDDDCMRPFRGPSSGPHGRF